MCLAFNLLISFSIGIKGANTKHRIEVISDVSSIVYHLYEESQPQSTIQMILNSQRG